MPRGLHVGCGSLRMYHGRMLLLSLAHHSGTRQSHLSQNGYGRSLRNGMTVFFFFFFFFFRDFGPCSCPYISASYKARRSHKGQKLLRPKCATRTNEPS
mmetsp:Transcript_15777/g.12643  ORF Transcript_15777/g.12643 Transcript_15777/m.12643 type:complete len:99 (+) Transcript_15777:147-443(+)